jgi:hypothetical protein
MSDTTSAAPQEAEPCSLESRYRQSAAFRAASVGRALLDPFPRSRQRIRLAAGFVLWPFLAVALQQHTGSFAAAFLLIPAAMACMALGVWWFTPDHAGQDLDQIET